VSEPIYVQYGCGFSAPDGWLNFDASPTLRLERTPVIGRLVRKNAARFPRNVLYGDIVRGLPVPNGVVRGLYASHILEHLSRSDFDKALKNSFDLMAPGGTFRLIVPDLEVRARAYVSAVEVGDKSANDNFMRSSNLGLELPPRGLVGYVSKLFGHSAHLWMWDYPSLCAALHDVGFVDVRRCDFGDGSDRMFALVEDYGRFYDDGLRELAVEAVRPA
jgi:hypothetical protein